MATYEDVWKVISESSQFQADLAKQKEAVAKRTLAFQEFGKEGVKALAAVEAAERKAAAEAKKAAAGPSEWLLAQRALTAELAGTKSEINKLREGTGQLAGAFSLISPELATLAQGAQKVEGIFGATAAGAELVGASLGTVALAAAPLAAGVGVLGLAWRQHNIDAEAAKKRLEDAQKAADHTRQAMGSLSDVIVENSIRQREAAGEITATEAAQLRAARSLANNYLPALREQATSLEIAKARLAELRREQEHQQDLAGDQMRNTLPAVTAAVAAQTVEVDKQRQAYAALAQRYQEARGGQQAAIGAEGALKDAKTATTAATKDATQAERDLEEQRKASQASASAYAAAMLVFTGAEDDYRGSLSKTDAALVKRDQTLAKLAESYQRAVEAAAELGDMEGLAAADAAYQRARVAAEAQANAEIEKLHDGLYDGLLKTARDEAQKEAAARQVVQDALLGQASAAASAIESAAGAESAAGKAAAATNILLGEIALFAAAAKYGPAAPAYIALGQIPLALAAAKLAGLGQADTAVTDSPRVMQAGPQGMTVRFAPGDQVAAARTRRELREQVGAPPAAPAHVTVALQVAGRTTQRIATTAKQTTRRSGRHQPAGTKGRG